MNVNASADSIEDAVSELRQILGQVIHALKERAASTEAADEIEPLKAALAEAGLAGRHKRLLVTLGSTGPISIGGLAQTMNLSSATTSLVAGQLERAGLLVRTEDPVDRRRTIASLPEHLQAPLSALVNASAEPLRRTLEQLESDAREQFLANLRLLAAELTPDQAE